MSGLISTCGVLPDGAAAARDSAESPQSIQVGSVHWRMLPSWQQVLLGPNGLKLDDWLAGGQAQIVKRGAGRTVYRVDLVGRSFFIKHYSCAALWDAGRNWIRRTASQREYDRAIEVGRRRIRTLSPVAVGECRRGGLPRDSFLVTEAIARACPLDEFVRSVLPQWPRQAQATLRRKLTLSMARLCAGAHQQGVFHDDFHAGNVLVQLDSCQVALVGDSLPALHLIDLPGIKISARLSWRRSRDSMVMLAAAWQGLLTRHELWRFWRSYVALRPELGLSVQDRPAIGKRRLSRRAWAAGLDVARRALDQARRIAQGRDRRALLTNRDFFAQKTAASAGHAVSAISADDLQGLMRQPDRLLLDNLHLPLKLTHRSVVVEASLRLEGRPVRVAYKRTRTRTWWKALAGLFRRSRAAESWLLGHGLLQRGIATARPLLVCNPRSKGLRWDSYLATQWIEGAQNLHVFLWQLPDLPADERRRRLRQTAAALGRLAGRMHAWQVSHRDFKGCNVVVVPHPERVDAYLIDLEGVRLARRVSPATRARNLSRMATSLEAHPWITRTDRLRFLRAYVRELSWEPTDWKSLWWAIARGRVANIRRLTRRGRQLV